MTYNGRDVLKGIAYDNGWTVNNRVIVADGIEYTLYSEGVEGGKQVVIGWTENNTGAYVNIDGIPHRGALALIAVRKVIEGN
jgi:hypothetical protein